MSLVQAEVIKADTCDNTEAVRAVAIEEGMGKTGTNVNCIAIDVPDSQDMQIARSMRRTLYVITSIDLFFNILAAIFGNYFNIVFMILVMLGWYGAKKYKGNFIIAYIMYAAIAIIVNICLLATLDAKYVGYKVLLALQAALYIWILNFSVKFYKVLEKLSESDLNNLRNPNHTGTTTLIVW